MKDYQPEVYFLDEMRYGTRTHAKRRWTRQGRRPVCQVKLGYAWAYLYVALCPYSGDVFAMFLSHLDKASFSLFLQHLHQHLLSKTAGKILLIGDGASAHTSQDWTSQPLHWQKLPTACPELNPVERFFEELRAQTANRIFQNKDELEKWLEKLILDWQRQPEKVKQLTYFPYLRLSA